MQSSARDAAVAGQDEQSVPRSSSLLVATSVNDSAAGSDTISKQTVTPGKNTEQTGHDQVPADAQPQSGLGLDEEQTTATDPFAQDQRGLQQVQEVINEYLKSSNRSLEFSFDEPSGRTVIKVMDDENDEVIRQIPPETALALIARIRDGDSQAATGLLIDNLSA
ncbi:flagellar protein FlaG [Rhabdochromatium marinum]|uniref:flagellar protein FlaG n=1 Tax=Rhabdochromatium marinum TaxID=48729 RepID=UPI0019066B72|nr:flagellar protein FlaG [Rhabdochromatium marinum]MBK1647608.1 hypothetical protein [Rhabdochromatium marinum]